MSKNRTQQNILALWGVLVTLIVVTLLSASSAFAAPNLEINYQGKLTDDTGATVPDGTYNMRFWLLTSASIATTSAEWTESLTGSNRVQVTNGLFSVMLGSTTPLTSVDFNQTLYLGVEIGGTGSPAWDGEMSPRKVLGTVPAAFVAETANNASLLGGVASTSFLRSDVADTASGLLTFTNGLISSASSTIFGLNTQTATTTNFVINGERFTDLTGTGLSNTGGVLTLDTASLDLLYASTSDFNTCSELASILTGQTTGTCGSLVFSASPTFTGTVNASALTLSSTLTMSGSAANIALGSNWLSGDGNDEGIFITNMGRVGIGTNAPSTAFEVVGDIVSNGTLWATSTASDPEGWYGITYGNGIFVAVSYDGYVMTSPDGINWTTQTAVGNDDQFFDVTYGNGLFVAVGWPGGDQIITSPDGINWTSRTTVAGSNQWKSVTYGGSLFVAVAQLGANRVMTSPDGINWTARTAAAAEQWTSVTYGNGMYVAVSGDGTVMTSSNGISWSTETAAEANFWTDVTYANGLFVAVAQTGTNRVMTSSDGATWIARSAAGNNDPWQSIIYGSGLFIAVAEGGGDVVMTSPDGINWATRSSAPSDYGWYSVAYGNGRFVAVNDGGDDQVMYSGQLQTPALAHNNIYQGGMNIFGNVGIGTSTPTSRLAIIGQAGSTQNIFSVASSTGTKILNVTNTSRVGIATSTPGYTLTVAGDAMITGALRGNNYSAGTNGMVLQTTGSGFNWVATSSLGFPAGHAAVTITGEDYLSLATQQITANAIDVDNLAAVDFGPFTCNGTTCSTDASSINESMLNINAATAGYVMQASSTASGGFAWVATSTLGIASGAGDFLSLTDVGIGSFNDGRLLFESATEVTDSADLTFANSRLTAPIFNASGASTTILSINNSPLLVASTTLNTIALGVGAKINATSTAYGSFFVGANAGWNAIDADEANFIGSNAGLNASNADYANFIGFEAGNGASQAISSNFIGDYAGFGAINSDFSNFIGSAAGDGATDAQYSNFFGSGAGQDATNAEYSNFLGYQSGYAATDAAYSNFLGYQSGYAATDATDSNFLGNNTGNAALYASFSNFFGTNAGQGAENADDGNFFGHNAGLGAVDANNSNFLGENAGSGATNAYQSNFFGTSAGEGATHANNSVFIGFTSGYQATHAENSFFVGNGAGYLATSSYSSNFLGQNAGRNAVNAWDSNFLGFNAGHTATNAEYSNFIGNQAGYQATNAWYSNFFGNNAGYQATNADNSNFLGYAAGFQASGAKKANFFGYNAGFGATNAATSSFIGYRAGYSADNASDALFLGSFAGYNDTVNNTSNGGSSIAIGRYAGTGGFSNSIALGRGVINSATTQLNIGNVLYGTGIYNSDTPSATPQGSGRLGIATSTPGYTLTVAGDAMITGALRGNNYSAGTNGMVLQTTGSGFNWVATSSLGFPAGHAAVTITGEDYLSLATQQITANAIDVDNLAAVDFGPFTCNGTTCSTDASSINESMLNINAATAGYVMQASSTAAGGFAWVATSTLGISSGAGDFLSLTDVGIGSFNDGRLLFESATEVTDSADLTFANSRLTAPIFNASGASTTLLSLNNSPFITASSTQASMGVGLLSGGGNGYRNTAFGYQSLANNEFGQYNIALGYRALQLATSTDENIGIGNEALRSYISQESNALNIALGSSALYDLSSGAENIAIGVNAGGALIAASNNTIIGSNAGSILTTGSNNLLLGSYTGDALGTGSNNIVLGYNIDLQNSSWSNRLNIGNLLFGTGIDGTGTTLSSGNIGIGTTTPNQKLSIFSNGADAAIEFSTISGANEKWTFGIDDSDGAKFKISSSSALGTNDRFVIDGAGRVGIGDTTPDDLLNIHSASAAAGLAITSLGTNVDPYVGFQLADGTNTFTMGIDDSDSDSFKISGAALGTSDYLTITTSGWFGMGADTVPDTFVHMLADTGDTVLTIEADDSNDTETDNAFISFQQDGETTSAYMGFGQAVTGVIDENTFVINQADSSGHIMLATNDIARLTVDSSGNIGIGDTTPSQILDIEGTNVQTLLEESTTEFTRVGIGETANTSILGWDDGDALLLGLYSSPTDTTIDTKMAILASGNVGIGTSTPNQKLSIFSNGADAAIELSTISGANEKWTFGIDDSDGAKFKISSSSALGTNDRLVIDGAGRVGIGTTTLTSLLTLQSNNNDALRVVRTDSGGANALFQNSTSGYTGTDGLYVGTSGGASYMWNYESSPMYFATANVTRMTITAGGNMGLGTTTANQALSIFRNGADAAIEFSTVSGANEKWSIGIDDSDGAKFKISSSSALGTNDRFVINGNGYVGIATSTPNRTLTVAGDARITGALYGNNNSAGTNGMVLQTTGSGFNWVATSSLGFPAGHAAVTITGEDYLSLATQQITANAIDVDNLAAVDFGPFTCNGTTCSTDASSINESMLNINAATAGYVMQASSTAAGGFAWVATSTLGISGAASLFTDGGATTYLAATSDNLAIGTTTSSRRLSVYDSGSNVVALFRAGFASSVIEFSDSAASSNPYLGSLGNALQFGTNGSQRMLIDNSGNVGIGTSTPNQALSIFRNGADAAIELSTVSGANEKWTMGIDDSDGNKFKISSSSALGTNDRLVIDGAGNIGIGTSTPTSKLHVWGSDTSGSTRVLAVHNSAALNTFGVYNNGRVYARYLTVNTTDSTSWLNVNSNDGAPIFTGYNSDTEVFRITGSGSLGIGTTTPNQKLSIFANGADAAIELSTISGANEKWTFGIDDSDGAKFKISSSSALGTNDRLIIDGAGNIGVGISPSESLFHIYKSSGTATLRVESAASGDAELHLRQGSQDWYIENEDGTNALTFIGESGEHMRITETGNLGIGTTTPNQKLSIFSNGADAAIEFSTISGANEKWSMGIDDSDGNKFKISSSSALGTNDRFVIDGAGNVGIGIASPSRRLYIAGTGNTTLAVRSDDDNDPTILLLSSSADASGDWGIYSDGSDGDKLKFRNEDGTNIDVLTLTQSADGGNVGIGTSTPNSLLGMGKTSGLTGSRTAGIDQYFNFTNSTASAIYYGDRSYITNAPTATSTLVGKMLRIEDDTALGNTVRGMEVQAHRGDNTQGENTGLSAFGRTFGLRGTTEGDAGGTFQPAGVFAQTRGTTQGNAIRAYSASITTEDLVSLFHDTSDFEGTGLLMNFGNGTGGSFSTSSGKFIDLQTRGVSKFTVTSHGTTTIGDGTTNYQAGLQIGFGGLCVDNDGSCNASTTGRITSVSSQVGNSDLAEMYFSSDDLQPGDIIATAGVLSIEKAGENNATNIIGVVSTKPGLTLGFDDESLTANQEGYPVALSGRVPVKLSTENGPIKAGDKIMLSSIPGVGMKATESGVVVGTALEDFDGAYAYSEGFVNQFGDDVAEPNTTPHNVATDARINDGCYFGAGGALGEEDEVCTPTEVERFTTIASAVADRNEEMRDALMDLAREDADVQETAEGEDVLVGQALMFVNLGGYQTLAQTDILNELTSTSTDLVLGGEDGETLWDRLKTLAQGFVDGVLSVAGLRAENVYVENQLCVDGVCVTADDLRALLEQANRPSGGSGDGVPPPPPEEEEEVEEGGSGGGGDTGGGEGDAEETEVPTGEPQSGENVEPEPEPEVEQEEPVEEEIIEEEPEVEEQQEQVEQEPTI